MSVHYKFKSALEYDTVTFDGLHISVKDLKNAIVQQKRIGRNTDFDLQITNAQTKEVYEDEDALIPKNTSLLIARIPLATQVKSKPWEGYGGDVTPQVRSDDGPIAKAVDLANLDAPEDDKIKAMMSQSTQDYDPSNYLKIRGANQMGAVPPNYRCYKCHQPGHWIKDCPLNQCAEPIEIKKSTGIPRSFMVPVEGPQVPGAMITPNGQYAVPALDHEAYTQKSAPAPPPIEEIKPDIPEDLVCTICSDLLTDAVMIPCCGNSFCDECIRGILLESEEHECPDCHEKDISPGTLIPNRYLRNSVSNFKNNTGYVKKPLQRPEIKEIKQSKFEPEAKPEVETKKEEKTGTIISEADSTEPPQSVLPDDFPEDTDAEISKLAAKDLVPEGPPGVSPRQSPQAQPIKNMMNAPRGDRHRDINGAPRHGLRRPSNDRSPRRQQRSHRSPSYGDTPTRHEERPGTPTVDEPGMGPTPNYPPNMPYNTGVVPPVMGLPQPSVMQGPPPFPPGQPPPGVYPPPPNFRLPPPAYMAPGHYNVPPRPVFDGGRPPMSSTVPYSGYPPRNRGREYMPPRSLRGRTPPGIIDDPLEAFNRMLREKDERERRAKLRKGRSYSRSSSRSVSRSPRRMRSRSPRRRSRSRSFSLSRSRSRSYSAGGRGSPPMRDVSPHPRRRANSRFRSPHRSPHHPRYVRETGRNFAAQNYRYKEGAIDRGRDRDYDRDYYNPSRREYRERERDRDADDYSHYDAYERDRERERSRHKSGGWMPPSSSSSSSHHHHHHHHHQHHQQSSSSSSHHGGAVAASVVSGASRGGGPPEGYYPPPPELQMSAYGQPPNRYAGPAPVRDAYPPYMPKPEPPQVQPQPAPPVGPVAMPPQHHHHHHHQRRYEEHIAPPGVEQPPVPGMEPSPRFEDRYAPPPFQQQQQQRAPGSRSPPARRGGGGADDGDALLAGKSGGRRQNRFGSKSPEKSSAGVGGSPVAAVKRVKESEKKRSSESRGRRREESSDREEGRHRRDASDDERTKKSKDKKKRKEKKEAERKKKKEKKDKERKKGEEKEKKSKAVQKEPKKKQPVEEEVAVPQEPKVSPPKSPPAKPMVSKEEATERNPEATPEKSKSPSTVTQPDLYGDLLTEDIDPKVVENYGKIPEEEDSRNSVERHRESLKNPEPTDEPKVEEENKQQSEAAREDDEEKDVLELHSSEADFMKAELEKSDILAPLPEKSKWEMDDEQTTPTSEFGHAESRHEKSGKVTNEVLKRAENAIFAKAINAIRPIEIKKISVDRAKLYSGEKERASRKADHFDIDNLQVTISSLEEADDADLRPPGTEAKVEPQVVVPEKPPQQRLSVKERLGVKVDDLDRIVKVEKNKSRSLSPLSKRAADMTRNYSQAERKVELEERKRHERRRGEEREKERHESRRTGSERREGRRDEITRREGFRRREEHHRERSRDRRDSEMKKAEKRKRSRSRSLSHDKKSEKDKKRIKKDKKQKKEKEKKKHHKKEDGDKKKEDSKIEKLEPQKQPKPTTDKRKPTLDESNFEPDYDLESESEKEEGEKGKVKVAAATAAIKSPISERKSTDSSDSSDSSSEDDRKRKKHVKKAKKKKSKRDSSSSSSDSDSETSDDEKDRKRRKHKKAKKKKKKSRHK